MDQATGQPRVELAERIKALDARNARIENELNGIDDKVSALMGRGVTFPAASPEYWPAPPVTPSPPGFPGMLIPEPDPFNSQWGELFGGMLAIQGLTFALLGVVLWRSFRRQITTRLTGEDANRLEQLQRSVDVMAVEVERISEGQRFTAKLLHDQVAEPARLAKDAERVR
jgi:hypothetical protein